MVGVVDVIGLGRREQHPVGAGREQAGQERVAAGPERHQHLIERLLQFGQRDRPGIDGGEHVHEHDLAVDALEMIAEERPDHMGLVGLETPLHEGGEAARRDRLALRQVEGREGERGRAGKIARHQEAPRRRRRHGLGPGAQGREIILEGLARLRRQHLVGSA